MPLSSQQVRKLRSLAHPLNPVVIIGGNGLTSNVQHEVDMALDQHELIKVRVNAGDRDERDAMIQSMCEQNQAELVQRIGHIAVLYRHNPERSRIELG